MATPVDLVLFENLLKAKSKDWAGERGNRRNNYELTSHSGNFGVGSKGQGDRCFRPDYIGRLDAFGRG